ncbi:wax ester/triacylglycerol synthase domain-containing protein [Thermoactinospora rubra]|uniref:wax ester/triacylglycerol synthase domain-containing protein n=1 Tax=Thermoactinospora rubra TaxID=1088767 RepID=UPI000A0F5542|nr:wax ester/triacylglycerol synthase domain-containing protein [Thermoactinospora rubra]
MRQTIERATPADLATRAISARGRVPQQMGAVLLLDGRGFDLEAAERLLAERAGRIPRLRQRLTPVPPGCGRPVWLDGPAFDGRRHVWHAICPAPGDERALLDLAAAIVTRPLPQDRPLWSAVFVTGLARGDVALVLVVDHVLTDGLGGLAVLAGLLDDCPEAADVSPRRPPTVGELVADAVRDRVRSLSRLPGWLRELRAALRSGEASRLAAARRCSLTRPTGARREVHLARVGLAELKGAAHRHGGTLNDAVLTVVTGALHRLLAARGESVEEFAVMMPVALRRATDTWHLGNKINPVLVTIPATGDCGLRLARTAAVVTRAKAAAARPSLIALFGPVFRWLARLGWHRFWMARQRFMHTLVTNVRGPEQVMALGGSAIREIVAMPVSENGNMPVTFAVLSYAGTVIISVIADPDALTDLPDLVALLREELSALCGTAAPR